MNCENSYHLIVGISLNYSICAIISMYTYVCILCCMYNESTAGADASVKT